jgi:squalene cyclase
MIDFQKSINFVDEKGSSLEKARLSCLLRGIAPGSDVRQEFSELQNRDGGFPFGMVKGNLSTINETTVALWWMEELDLLSSVFAQQAFGYLLSTQQADGGWDEDVRIAQYDLPPWILLGDQKTKLYLSAYAAYWFAVGGYKHLSAFRKALHLLIRNQDQSGRVYGYLHTTWIAAAVFITAGERYSSVARLAIQALSERPLADWDDSQIAWALDCLSRAGLPHDHQLMEAGLAELPGRQNSDGSWASEDGEDNAVSATIQVLKVFNRFGILPPDMTKPLA